MDKKIIFTAVFSVAMTGSTMAYCETSGIANYEREHPNDIRVMSYNLHGDLDPQQLSENAFSRIVFAVNPDIVVFQEVTGSIADAEDFSGWLNHQLPQNSWQVLVGLSGGVRTIVASHLPMSMQEIDTIPESSTRGVTMCLVDLPDSTFSRDAYILGVHFKCCDYDGDNDKRQKSADAIATWMGDARFAGRHIDLPFGTPMILTGDMNLVGGPQPEITMLTGDIIDESTYCTDIKGDWDNTNLLDVAPMNPNTGDDFTWQGSDWYDPSRLDRFMVTDSAMTIGNNYVLNTDTMSSYELSVLGLQASDTLPSSSSDHLPIVFDFQPNLESSTCSGDSNGDGVIGVNDILAVIDDWAPDGTVCCPGCVGDVDGNLVVDVADILFVVGNWGACQ